MHRMSNLSIVIAGGLLSLLAMGPAVALEPELSSFLQNTDGATGSSSDPELDALASTILVDVQQVSYTDSDVYIETTGVPRYPTGPYPDNNPSYASDTGAIYQLPRTPSASADPEAVGLGAIGVFVNGVAIFNAEDGNTWNDQNVWHRNAILAEADGFDDCNGHPAPIMGGADGCEGFGETWGPGIGPPPEGCEDGPGGDGGTGDDPVAGRYHHHFDPVCLIEQVGDDGSSHSTLLGFAWDGFPVYGPYGYDDPLHSGSGVVRMESGYAARDIGVRETLPDGTALAAAFYGPDVSESYPIGWYMEDFVYTDGSGHLDAHNGRFAITPDYPGGTYAYHVTLGAEGDAAYPYSVGDTYYGDVTGGDAASIPGDAVVYVAEPEGLPMALVAQLTLAALLGLFGAGAQRIRNE